MEGLPTAEQLQELLDGPSMKPPAGVMPNFVDPANFHVVYIATVVVCLSFVTSSLFMRIYVKIYIIHKTEWADCKALHFAPLMNL
jgi:hypothetical protein